MKTSKGVPPIISGLVLICALAYMVYVFATHPLGACIGLAAVITFEALRTARQNRRAIRQLTNLRDRGYLLQRLATLHYVDEAATVRTRGNQHGGTDSLHVERTQGRWNGKVRYCVRFVSGNFEKNIYKSRAYYIFPNQAAAHYLIGSDLQSTGPLSTEAINEIVDALNTWEVAASWH